MPFSPHIWALLILTPIMIAGGQILFKMTSARLASSNGSLVQSVLLEPLFVSALVIYGSATLIWIYVLKSVPLAQAYSFMALTFVIVPILAVWLLGETTSWKFFAGTALIMTGLVIIHS
ncbi:MAG: EamA family transporter [Pseudomonadota bacterium]